MTDWFTPNSMSNVIAMPRERLEVTLDQAINLQRNFDVMLEDLKSQEDK